MDFRPGDFIITNSGQKGYIIESTDSSKEFFYIRIGNQYHTKSIKELKPDTEHE